MTSSLAMPPPLAHGPNSGTSPHSPIAVLSAKIQSTIVGLQPGWLYMPPPAPFASFALNTQPVTVGLLPVTGLPLPFLSFGGSFYLSMMLALGIVHSIWIHRSRVPTGAVPAAI